MKKVLLSVAAFSFITAGYAQLLTYGFEESDQLPGIIVGENWDNYPNCTYNWESTEAPHTGARALTVHIDPADCGEDGTTECGSWERVVAITNTGFGENKSYRVTLWSKGSGRINVALLKGCFYHDKAGYDQTSTVTVNGEYTKQVFTFWAPDREYFIAQSNDFASDEYWNQDFLRLSFLAAGDYNIDDITIEESSVKKVSFNGNTVCLEYAWGNNIASLAAGAVTELEGVTATVSINGVDKEVRNVEAHADGKLYLFLGDVEAKKADAVKVSLTNAGPLAFNMGGSYNFTAEACPSITFEGEVAEHDQNLVVTSFADAEPKLLSANPANGSFEIEADIKSFSFTFDHVITVDDPDYAVKASLDGEALVLKTTENAATVEFERASNAALKDGMHVIRIENVATDVEVGQGMWNDGKYEEVSFEVGAVKVAEIVYSDPARTLFTGAGDAIPDNATCFVQGDAENPWTGGTEWAGGSACRNLNVTGIDGNEYTAFYLCDRDGYTYLQYNEPITLPVGNVEFSVIALSHDEAGHSLEYRLEDMEGNEILTGSGACSVIANNQFTSIEASDFISVKFENAAEKQAILKVHALGGGYTAVRVLGFQTRTYTMTEGDSYDPEVVFQSNFTGANMPEEGSGWLFYNANNQLAPGSGRNGTSGMLERNFHAKMQTAAFFRECGENADAAHRIEYGNGNGVEGGLEIAPGSYDIVFYAGTWNDAAGNANGTSTVTFQLIDAESGAVAFTHKHVNIANFENGGACNGQADKVELVFKTSGGHFIIKAFGSHNTVWGGLSIQKQGSQAVKYHSKLNEALEAANAELNSSADAMYDGTTKTALIAAVAKYSAVPNGMHTGAEYDAACAELNDLTSALATRRTTIAKYDQVKIDIDAYLNGETAIDAKYEALDSYKVLTTTYATYKDITAQSLEDAELVAATNTLETAFASTKFMVETGVPALTAQITELINQLVALDDTQTESELVIAAGNAISDDQIIANQLKLQVLQALYNKIATDDNFFVEVDEEMIESPKPFDVTSFIQNPKVYTNAPKHDACTIANYPGWTSDKPDFAMRPNYGWGGWDANSYYLIHANDMFIGIGWVGNDGVTVTNNVEYLPVGLFDLTIATMDRSGAGDWTDGANTWPNPERQLSYIFIQQGEEEAKTQAFNCENLGQYYGFTDDVMEDVALTGEVYADAKIGAYIHAQESFAAIRNVRLSLKAKAENFNYAEAAQALQGVIDGIQVVAREDAPVAARYFNLNGQEINEAAGVCIKVETYADGYTVVKKIVK